jgi:putative acetyltransferase
MGARVTIRKERASDREQVFEVHAAAFETPAEARLVDALRKVAKPLVSLVAVREKRVVGHVLFTPASVAGGLDRKRAMGLAPLAVLPEHQRQGIGLRLVRAGLEACRHLGRDVIFVLGHPEYYPRFGFRPASERGLCYNGVELGSFMVLGLRTRSLEGLTGNVRYHPLFDAFDS